MYQWRTSPEKYDGPGTISDHGVIVNLYGQFLPGPPIEDRDDARIMRSRYGPRADTDTRDKQRLEWFEKGLFHLEVILLARSNISIAFPSKIGCGMGHGDWNQYYAAIEALAMRKPTWSVHIYDWTLPRIDDKPSINGKHCVADPALCSEGSEAPVNHSDESRSPSRSCLKKVGPIVAKNDALITDTNNSATAVKKAGPECDIANTCQWVDQVPDQLTKVDGRPRQMP